MPAVLFDDHTWRSAHRGICVRATATCSQATAWPSKHPRAGKRLGGQRNAML